jgi:hypothetical protein
VRSPSATGAMDGRIDSAQAGETPLRCPRSANRLHAARAAFTKVRKDRELYEAAGIGPGDAYAALWSHVIEIRNQWQSQQHEEGKRYYSLRYADVLSKLLPYERPRLQVVKVKTEGDQLREPEEMARALAKALTPEELELLDKVALKLVSAPAQIDGKAEPEPVRPKRSRPSRK